MERPFQKDTRNTTNRSQNDVREQLHTGESSLVSAFSLIWRVIVGRRYAVPNADIPDVAQETLLRLWKWREKYAEKAEALTIAEWDSFAAKTAHNEVNRFLSNRNRTQEVSIDEASQMATPAQIGNVNAEVVSLVANVWQEICRLTLYQRRALLLNAPELLIYFMQFGIGEPEIVASLGLNEGEWADISGRLPLSDKEIAAMARSSRAERDPTAATRAIVKARFDARRKLKRFKG